MKPILGSQLQGAYPLSKGLVGCWLFNENPGKLGKVYDLSGNGHTGTLVADAQGVPGKFGSAIDFDAADDRIDVPFGAQLNGKHLTVLTWVKWRGDSNTYPRIVDREYDGQFTFYFIDSVNELTWALSTAGGDVDYAGSGTVVVSQNVWMQAVLTYDGSDARIYVDGILKDTFGGGISGGLSASAANIVFGDRSDTPGSREIDGQIDHAAIWNRALSAREIKQLYIDPFAMFKRERIWLYPTVIPSGGYMDLNTGYWGY